MSRIQIQDVVVDGSAAKAVLNAPPPMIDPAKVEEARTARLARLRAKMPLYYFRQVERTPPKYQGARIKAHLGEASPRLAIKAKCEECVGYESIKEQVGDCRSYGCPLHAYRPYQAVAK